MALPAAPAARGARASSTRTSSSPTRSLGFISNRYSREAGLRNFERNLAGAHAQARAPQGRRRGGRLGRRRGARRGSASASPRYSPEEAEKEPEIGAVTGLAWTTTGGDIMTIEALRMPGTGTAHRHRAARRRDARIRGRRAIRSSARAPTRSAIADAGLQGERSAHPLPGGRDSQGRAECRHRGHARDRERAEPARRCAATWR